MNKFDLIKKEIDEQLQKSEISTDYKHAQLVLKWLLKLKPKADISMQIAAIGHDYDRSFPNRERVDQHNTYDEYKKAHAKKSARMILELMKKHNFTQDEINRTVALIESHEVGGKGDFQILTDADSIAFFEYNLPYYRKTHTEEQTKSKIVFMYKRISGKSRQFLNQIKFKDKELNKLFLSIVNNL